MLAGDDDLARRIEIGSFGNAGRRCLLAHIAHGLVIQAKNRSHRALARGHGILHQLGADLDDANSVGKFDGAGANQSRVLAEAVPGHCGGLFAPPLLPQPPGCDTGGQHRRLRDDGLIESLGRPFLHQLPQVITEYAAGFTERSTNFVVLCGELGEHALRLRSLPGKYECQRHVCSSYGGGEWAGII